MKAHPLLTTDEILTRPMTEARAAHQYRPRAALGWLGVLLVLVMAAPSIAAPQSPALNDTLQRSVSLAELGFERGVEFLAFGGQRDFYFPAPRKGLKAATLKIKLHTGAAVQGRRHLQVMAGERILLTQPLGTTDTEQAIDVNIDPQLAKDGFLQISMRYSGAFTQDRCMDQRVAGDFLTILPASTLELALTPDAYNDIRSVVGLMPREVSIGLPGRPLGTNDVAAALRVASALQRHGFSARFAPALGLRPANANAWARGVVLVGQPQDFPGITADAKDDSSSIALANLRPGPALLVNSKNPVPAITLLTSRWQALADGATLSVNGQDENAASRQSLSLADLGMRMQSADLVDQVRFDTSFSSDVLPPAHRIRAVRFDLALGVAPDNANATISAFLNGRLLGSRTSPGAVPATLTVSVPEGLVTRENTLSVRVQRQPHTGDCMNPPQGYTVQLLPSSSMELSGTAGSPNDFFSLGSLFRGGVDVILPANPAELADAMTLFNATVAGLLPDAAQVNVHLDETGVAPQGPFIAVSRSVPPGTNPNLRFDKGRLTVNRGDGAVLLDVATGEIPAVAQIVHTDTATGIWLRPGSLPAAKLARPVKLDRGNVAVIDDTGIALAFSSGGNPLVNISYVDIRSWTDLALEYRPWVVGAAWLALSLLFAAILSRIYRSRRKG